MDPRRSARRRAAPRSAAAAAALAGPPLAALPGRRAGQRCHVDRTPGHDDRHEETRAQQELRERIEAAAEDVGLDDHPDEIGRAMEFEPASLNGVPLGTWVRRNVTFDLRRELRRRRHGPPPGRPPG